MYLNRLEDKSKEFFLELAFLISLADGKLSLEEKQLLKSYKAECLLENYKFKGLNLSEIKKHFFETEKDVQKIIIFELLGLSYIDNDYHESEKKIINDLSISFNIDNKIVDAFEKDIIELNRIYTSTSSIIFNQKK